MQIIIYNNSGKMHYNVLNAASDQIFDHEIPTWELAAEVMYNILYEHRNLHDKIIEVFTKGKINTIDFDGMSITRIQENDYYDFALRHMFKYVYSHFFGGDQPLPFDELHMKCNIGLIINEVYDMIEQ